MCMSFNRRPSSRRLPYSEPSPLAVLSRPGSPVPFQVSKTAHKLGELVTAASNAPMMPSYSSFVPVTIMSVSVHSRPSLVGDKIPLDVVAKPASDWNYGVNSAVMRSKLAASMPFVLRRTWSTDRPWIH